MVLLSQFLVFIYRLKFDAFSDIDNFVDHFKIYMFDIDKLPMILEMLIYWLYCLPRNRNI